MEVGEWTEVGNINRGKIMEKAPIRGPRGVVHEVGVLPAKRPTKTLLFLQLFFTWMVTQEAQIIIILKKKGQQNNK